MVIPAVAIPSGASLPRHAGQVLRIASRLRGIDLTVRCSRSRDASSRSRPGPCPAAVAPGTAPSSSSVQASSDWRLVSGPDPRLRRQLAITPVGAPTRRRQQPKSRSQLVHVHLCQRRVRQVDRDDRAAACLRRARRSGHQDGPSSSSIALRRGRIHLSTHLEQGFPPSQGILTAGNSEIYGRSLSWVGRWMPEEKTR